MFQLELLLMEMKVALDTANGAASTSARQIFADLGAQIDWLSVKHQTVLISTLMLVQHIRSPSRSGQRKWVSYWFGL